VYIRVLLAMLSLEFLMEITRCARIIGLADYSRGFAGSFFINVCISRCNSIICVRNSCRTRSKYLISSGSCERMRYISRARAPFPAFSLNETAISHMSCESEFFAWQLKLMLYQYWHLRFKTARMQGNGTDNKDIKLEDIISHVTRICRNLAEIFCI